MIFIPLPTLTFDLFDFYRLHQLSASAFLQPYVCKIQLKLTCGIDRQNIFNIITSCGPA